MNIILIYGEGYQKFSTTEYHFLKKVCFMFATCKSSSSFWTDAYATTDKDDVDDECILLLKFYFLSYFICFSFFHSYDFKFILPPVRLWFKYFEIYFFFHFVGLKKWAKEFVNKKMFKNWKKICLNKIQVVVVAVAKLNLILCMQHKNKNNSNNTTGAATRTTSPVA